MRRAAVLVLLAVSASAADVGSHQYMVDLIEFHRHYSVFFRAIMGCPADATLPEQCRPVRGFIDQRARKRMIAAAPAVLPQKKTKGKKNEVSTAERPVPHQCQPLPSGK